MHKIFLTILLFLLLVFGFLGQAKAEEQRQTFLMAAPEIGPIAAYPEEYFKDHNYYYYFGLDVARSALGATSTSEAKQVAIISQLKQDGYFDLLTAEAKKQYLLNHAPALSDLWTIYEAEEQNGWSVPPVENGVRVSPYNNVRNKSDYLEARAGADVEMWGRCFFYAGQSRPTGMTAQEAFKTKRFWREEQNDEGDTNPGCYNFLYGGQYLGSNEYIVGQWADLAENYQLHAFTQHELARLDKVYAHYHLSNFSTGLPVRWGDLKLQFSKEYRGVEGYAYGVEVVRKDTGASVLPKFEMDVVDAVWSMVPLGAAEPATRAKLAEATTKTNFLETAISWFGSLFKTRSSNYVSIPAAAPASVAGSATRFISPAEKKITMVLTRDTFEFNAFKMFKYGTNKMTEAEKYEMADYVANKVLKNMGKDEFLSKYFTDDIVKNQVDNFWIVGDEMFENYYSSLWPNYETRFMGFADKTYGQIVLREEVANFPDYFAGTAAHEAIHLRANTGARFFGNKFDEGLTDLTTSEYMTRVGIKNTTGYPNELYILYRVRLLYQRCFSATEAEA